MQLAGHHAAPRPRCRRGARRAARAGRGPIAPTTAPSTRTDGLGDPGGDRPHGRARGHGHQQPVPHELAHRGQRRGDQRVRRPVVRDRQQLHELAERQRALAAREQGRGRAVHLVPPPRPVLRGPPRRPPSSSPRRPGSDQRSSSTRVGERQPGGQQRGVVGVGAQPVDAVQPALDLRARAGRRTARGGPRTTTVGAPSVRRSVSRPNPTASTVRAVHPVQPGPRPARGRRGRPGRGRRRAARCRRAAPGRPPRAAPPTRRTPAGSQDRTRSGQSSPRTCSHDASSCATPPGARCPARSRDERGEGRVAVLRRSRGRRTRPARARARTAGWTRSGRTGGPPPGPATGPSTSSTSTSLSANVAGRQRERPRRHVRAGDPAGVPRGVQRLHPAAGAEVEHRAHRAPDGRGGQRQRRRPDAGDVVALLAAGVEVGEHPPVGPVGHAVGPQVERGPPPGAVGDEQARRRGVGRGERGERGGDGGVRLDRAEQQQPDQHAERVRVRGGAVGGLGLAAAERRVRARGRAGSARRRWCSGPA